MGYIDFSRPQHFGIGFAVFIDMTDSLLEQAIITEAKPMLMLNKHTRRRFLWWFDKLRKENDPFTSVIKAGLVIQSLQRRETKQKGGNSMPDWVGKESQIASPLIIGELGEVK